MSSQSRRRAALVNKTTWPSVRPVSVDRRRARAALRQAIFAISPPPALALALPVPGRECAATDGGNLCRPDGVIRRIMMREDLPTSGTLIVEHAAAAAEAAWRRGGVGSVVDLRLPWDDETHRATDAAVAALRARLPSGFRSAIAPSVM